MFNQYKYQHILQVKIIPLTKEFRGSSTTEYAGDSFDEIDEEFRKDYNIPEDFKLKSKFEFEGNLFRLKYLYWGSREEVFDPFDELEDEK